MPGRLSAISFENNFRAFIFELVFFLESKYKCPEVFTFFRGFCPPFFFSFSFFFLLFFLSPFFPSPHFFGDSGAQLPALLQLPSYLSDTLVYHLIIGYLVTTISFLVLPPLLSLYFTLQLIILHLIVSLSCYYITSTYF